MPFRRIRIVAWIAALAVLLQALWPLLSHARPLDPSLVIPACTIDGVTHFLEIKAGKKTPLDERSATHGEHCKLCVFGGDKAAVVDELDAVVLISGTTQASPLARFVPLAVPTLRSPAHPRAPPVQN
jgi:hypothetical protein